MCIEEPEAAKYSGVEAMFESRGNGEKIRFLKHGEAQECSEEVAG